MSKSQNIYDNQTFFEGYNVYYVLLDIVLL